MNDCLENIKLIWILIIALLHSIYMQKKKAQEANK